MRINQGFSHFAFSLIYPFLFNKTKEMVSKYRFKKGGLHQWRIKQGFFSVSRAIAICYISSRGFKFRQGFYKKFY